MVVIFGYYYVVILMELCGIIRINEWRNKENKRINERGHDIRNID